MPVLFAAVIAASPAAAQRPEGAANCDALTATPNGRDARAVSPRQPNPLEGLSFYVDEREPAAVDRRRYLFEGRRREAALLEKLATVPKFRWFGRFSPMSHVRHFLRHAQCEQPGSVPLLVTMRHQGTACNPSYDGGGRREDAASRAWYRAFARTIDRARVVIAFEPDGIGTINCLARSRRAARRDLLRYGVDVLSGLPNATIYLDGTASDWKSVRYTARMLRRTGISKVRGFMLNATHYDWTMNNVRYGRAVSRLVGGKPFIINTATNGRGPVHYKIASGRRINVYCNPQYRGLGPAPTAATGLSKVDAFMYINRPGISGAGTCNGAPQRAGTWWPERALMYGRWATDWLAPPRGSRQGHHAELSLCELGAPLVPPRVYSSLAPETRCRRVRGRPPQQH